jgi:hypothetical protein
MLLLRLTRFEKEGSGFVESSDVDEGTAVIKTSPLHIEGWFNQVRPQLTNLKPPMPYAEAHQL